MKKISSNSDLVNFIIHKGNKNIGYMHTRMKYDCEQSNREKAFARLWRKENKKRSWINSGHGILQDLFFYTASLDRAKHFPLLKIISRDRVVAATVIQWLGSNCGFAFLEKALRKSGYRITKIK